MRPGLRELGREEEKRPSGTRSKNKQPELNNKADTDVFTSVWKKCKVFFQKSCEEQIPAHLVYAPTGTLRSPLAIRTEESRSGPDLQPYKQDRSQK